MLAASVGVLLAGAAQAAPLLSVDVRSAGVGGVAIPVLNPTQVISTLELWGSVTGGTGGTANEGLWKVVCYVTSKNYNGGVLLGTLTDAWASPPPDWYNGGAGGTFNGQNGYDLDSDTDVDLGYNIDTTSADQAKWIIARAGSMQTAATVDYAAYKLLTMEMAGMAWASANPHGYTVIEATPRAVAAVQLFKVDGVSKTGASAGTSVTLFRPDEAHAGPPVQLDKSLPGMLDGSASLGTISLWSWDIDGDGSADVFGPNVKQVALTYDPETKVLSWGTGQKLLDPGEYLAKLHVESPWTNSDSGTKLTLLPEPATMALLGLGGLLVAVRRRFS
jgi:hypothetical protein